MRSPHCTKAAVSINGLSWKVLQRPSVALRAPQTLPERQLARSAASFLVPKERGGRPRLQAAVRAPEACRASLPSSLALPHNLLGRRQPVAAPSSPPRASPHAVARRRERRPAYTAAEAERGGEALPSSSSGVLAPPHPEGGRARCTPCPAAKMAEVSRSS